MIIVMNWRMNYFRNFFKSLFSNKLYYYVYLQIYVKLCFSLVWLFTQNVSYLEEMNVNYKRMKAKNIAKYLNSGNT
jgi:hypothetical protein